MLNGGGVEPTRTRMVAELRHNSPFISCRFDPSGQFVFAGAQDNTIQRFALASNSRVAFEGHRSWVRAIAFHATGKLISSASPSKAIGAGSARSRFTRPAN